MCQPFLRDTNARISDLKHHLFIIAVDCQGNRTMMRKFTSISQQVFVALAEFCPYLRSFHLPPQSNLQ